MSEETVLDTSRIGPADAAPPDSGRRHMLLLERAVQELSELQPPDALRHSLHLVAEHQGWSAGQVYLRRDNEPGVKFARLWFEAPLDVDPGRPRSWRSAMRAERLRSAARVMQRGDPGVVYNVALDPVLSPLHATGLRFHAMFPVMTPLRTVAVLEFMSGHATRLDTEFLRVMEVIGTQLGFLIERSKLERRLARVTVSEQQRIAMELHDTVGQEATAIGILATMLQQDLERRSAPEQELADRLLAAVQQLKGRVRDFVATLRSVSVDPGVLAATLEDLAERYARLGHCRCSVSVDEEIRVTDSFAATRIVRIAREALHNAILHGRPSHVSVSLTRTDDDTVMLEVMDDGSGASPERLRGGGLGQEIMRYGADTLSADLDVGIHPQGGVRVRCEIPVESLLTEHVGER